MHVEKILLYFFVFSFFGWFYESFLCTTYHNRPFINKGFLMGPYCPIYGIGATASLLLFGNYTNMFLLFFASSLFCGELEYLTSYGLEKIFHERWWDYSNCSFHINGRVCLYGIVSFGAANVIICRFIAPFLDKMMDLVGSDILSMLSFLLMTIFIMDIIATLMYRKNFNQDICRQYEKIHLEIDRVMEGVSVKLLEQTHDIMGSMTERK